MSIADLKQVQGLFNGRFLTEPVVIQEKLFRAKAFVFDWDGVFNNGAKDENGSSPFSEIDSMGINMLRFNHYLLRHLNPLTAIITGERNKAAYMFARREHFHAVYYNIKNKRDALDHLCATHHIEPHEVVYFFDDVLDLAVAEVAGLRIMIGNRSTVLLQRLAQEHKMVDYITAADAGNNAIREAVELLIGLTGKFEETILQRSHYSPLYARYIEARNAPDPLFYSSVNSTITEQIPQ